ncbi:MAG TPA: MBL fold metallo-hydrolase [Acidimicrobiales bacterium]|nr:MBL fold metallo-hydrolase [Acidimicrobiales bacterium]
MPAELVELAHDRPETVAPGVVRITAANPGMMTGPGTNTYLLGADELAVIDPGPDDAVHLDAVAEAGGGRIRWIFVTHTHPDHAPGAAGLAGRTGAERLGFASRDGFRADRTIVDGFELRRPGLSLRAVHTPGHASNHLCYLADLAPEQPGTASAMLFTGDHVMEGSTVVISPPDGDMTAYLASLALLGHLEPGVDVIAPGHGRLIEDPGSAVRAYIAHRLQREERVVTALAAAGSATVDQLVPVVYQDVDEDRFPVARRSLWAHLRKLADDGRARSSDGESAEAAWEWLGAQAD